VINLFGYKIPSSTFFHWLFHIVFWTLWISFPFFTDPGDENKKQFAIAAIPIVLSNIPLFLLNSDWLIPKIYGKKGIGYYLLGLAILLLFFLVIQLYLREWFVPAPFIHRNWDIMDNLSHVLFVASLSTGYGFLRYFLKKENLARAEKEAHLQSELSFLRSQISPHFFFNVLNSIVYLIRSKSELAEPVTIKLSELMRYMLYQSSETQVALSQELTYLENYIDLQRVRFEEDVLINFDIKGVVQNRVIEPMLLIPFVENAFKHGIGMVIDPIIEVQIKVEDTHLQLKVYNKITPERKKQKNDSSGIGLQNVKRRLDLLYPDAHQLQINQTKEFFEVMLDLDLNR